MIIDHAHEHEVEEALEEALELDTQSQIFLEMRRQNLDLLRIATEVAGYTGEHGPLKPGDLRNALKTSGTVYSEFYTWVDPEEAEDDEDDDDEDEDDETCEPSERVSPEHSGSRSGGCPDRRIRAVQTVGWVGDAARGHRPPDRPDPAADRVRRDRLSRRADGLGGDQARCGSAAPRRSASPRPTAR